MNTPFKVRKDEEISPELSLDEINILKEELEVEDDTLGIRRTGDYICKREACPIFIDTLYSLTFCLSNDDKIILVFLKIGNFKLF